MGRVSLRNIVLVLVALHSITVIACEGTVATEPVDQSESANSAENGETQGRPESIDSSVRVQSTATAKPKESSDLFERVWQTRIARGIGDTACDTSPHELNPDLYVGPLIETHFHIPHMPDSRPVQGELTSSYLDVAGQERFNIKFPLLGVNNPIAKIACTLEHEGTDGVFAFFPVCPQMAGPSIEVVKRTMDLYPDLLFPFINAGGNGTATAANPKLIESQLRLEVDFIDRLIAEDEGAPG